MLFHDVYVIISNNIILHYIISYHVMSGRISSSDISDLHHFFSWGATFSQAQLFPGILGFEVFRTGPEWCRENGVELIFGKATKIDRSGKSVEVESSGEATDLLECSGSGPVRIWEFFKGQPQPLP